MATALAPLCERPSADFIRRRRLSPQPQLMSRCRLTPERPPQTSFGPADEISADVFFAPRADRPPLRGSVQATVWDCYVLMCSPYPCCIPCRNAACCTMYNLCCPTGQTWANFCQQPYAYLGLGACCPPKQCAFCCVCCDPTHRCMSLIFWAQRLALSMLTDIGQVFGFATDGADDFAPKGYRVPLGPTNDAMRCFQAIPDLGSAVPCLACCMACCCVRWETQYSVDYQTIPLNDVVRQAAATSISAACVP